MKNLFYISLMTMGGMVSLNAFATEAEQAASAKCTCKKTDTAVFCGLGPFPEHLEGVSFRSDRCTLKEGSETSYQCTDTTFNFSDGSSLPLVTCDLAGPPGATAKNEIDGNPILAFVKKIALAISTGEDSDAKTQINAVADQARDAVALDEKRTAAIQSGIDAYEKAKGSLPDAAREPASK